MPLYDVALQIDVVPGTDPTVVVRGVNAAGGTSPTTEELLTLYQEVGEHERHYSNIRMTATALLFTIAVLAIGGVNGLRRKRGKLGVLRASERCRYIRPDRQAYHGRFRTL
jgi:hypothetical protein